MRYESATKILKELGEDAEKAAKEGLAEGAELMVQEAKARCPVYEGKRKDVIKGALRDSIHARTKNKGARIDVVADATAKDGFLYGRIVEFSPKINKPFMYPAYEATKEQVKEKIIEAVRRAILKR